MISSGLIMWLTGQIKCSSFTQGQQTQFLNELPNMCQNEANELAVLLSMHQLDLTQLSIYTKADINKRLDYIDQQTNM